MPIEEEVTITAVPPFESIHRIIEFPIIKYVCNETSLNYSRLKEAYKIIHWSLRIIEFCFNNFMQWITFPLFIRISKRLRNPINFADRMINQLFDLLEIRFPMVKESPEIIFEYVRDAASRILQSTKSFISHAFQEAWNQAIWLANAIWNQINHLLSTRLGLWILGMFYNIIVYLEKLSDKYFPLMEKEIESEIELDSSLLQEDKLLQMIQTGRKLSDKIVRGIYYYIAYQLNIFEKDYLRVYIISVIEFFHLIQYLHIISDSSKEREKLKENGKKSN